jgi:hypothetical protein
MSCHYSTYRTAVDLDQYSSSNDRATARGSDVERRKSLNRAGLDSLPINSKQKDIGTKLSRGSFQTVQK